MTNDQGEEHVLPDQMRASGESAPATFTMLCCAHGAESAIKQDLANDGWRLSFSRPGFVTLKHPQRRDLPDGIFVRTASSSIGSARATESAELITMLTAALRKAFPVGHQFAQLHVWPRDRTPIGRFGFEPGSDEVSKLVAETIHSVLAAPNETVGPPESAPWIGCDRPNQISQPGEDILDIVLVDPSHWFIGWHRASTWPTRWPGGVQPMQPKYEPVSRAYYKAAEAITWSGFDLQPGDLAVEIGSAPGGACGRLLELGLQVLGIDPAEMDPRISGHPKFRHIQARAGDLKRREFRGAKWMLVDSNVKPDKTLVTVENIVMHPSSTFRGLLLTMKLGDYSEAESIQRWRRRIRRWNAREIRIRQLARNKCEVCFAIKM